MTDPISEEELENIRAEQEVFMPQRGIIRRRRYDGDSQYEAIVLYEDVPLRLTPGFGFWRVVADRFQGMTPFRATVPWDQDLKSGDIIVDEESRSYEVRDVMNPSTYHTARQALCDMVTDA